MAELLVWVPRVRDWAEMVGGAGAHGANAAPSWLETRGRAKKIPPVGGVR